MIKKWWLVCGIVCMAAVVHAQARQEAHWSLATGEAKGMYFWTGALLAALVAVGKEERKSCQSQCGENVPVVLPEVGSGSVDNIAHLLAGEVDSAIVQSNVLLQAYRGEGAFTVAAEQLRALASLYPEVLHVMVRRDSGIEQMADLRGKQIAVGGKASGTAQDAQLVLKAYGIEAHEYVAKHLSLEQAEKAFVAKEIDAIFFLSAQPNPFVVELAEQTPIRLLAVDWDKVATFSGAVASYHQALIPENRYQGQQESVSSIGVNAIWVTRAKQDALEAEALVSALWQAQPTLTWLRKSLPDGFLKHTQALDGIAIPLHAGAQRYYQRIGKRF